MRLGYPLLFIAEKRFFFKPRIGFFSDRSVAATQKSENQIKMTALVIAGAIPIFHDKASQSVLFHEHLSVIFLACKMHGFEWPLGKQTA